MIRGPATKQDPARIVELGAAAVEGLSIIFFDQDLRIVAVHGAAAGRHGHPAERVVGRRVPDVLPAPVWATLAPLYACTLDGATLAVRLPTADGTALFETSFQPVLDDGVVIGGTATSRDVTAAADAEERLRRSERDFRLLAERSTDMITRTTPAGEVLYVSPASRTVLGLEPAAYVDQGAWWALVDPRDRPALQQEWRRVLQEHSSVSVEYRVRRPDGTVAWVQSDLRVIRDPGTDLVTEIHGSSRDITERKVGEEASRVWRASFETAPRGVAICDPEDGRLLEVNPAFAALHGGQPGDFTDRPLADVLGGAEQDRSAERTELLRRVGHAEYETEHRRLDGTSFPVGVEVLAVTDASGAPRLIASYTDLTRLRAREASERRAVARFEQSFVEAPVGMLLLVEGRIVRANRAIAALIGVEAEALLGRDPRDFVHPEDRELIPAAPSVTPTELWVVTPDGRTLLLRLRTSVLAGEEQRVVLVHALDVTERHVAMRELDTTRKLFETTFQHAPTGMIVADRHPDGSTILRCNVAFARMVGRAPQDVVGCRTREFVHPDDALVGRRMVTDALAGRPGAAEVRLLHGDGTAVWTLAQPVALTGPAGEPLLLMQAQDISERKRFERQLRFLADHDVLTGLCSRSRFESELEREVSLIHRLGGEATLLLLDLDGFKDVNDLFGHSVGDELLTRIAAAISRELREVDLVARLGGDEFAVVLPGTGLEGGRTVAATLVDAVRAEGRVIRDGRHAEVTASVGITTLDGEHDAEELLVEADIAMYQAKDAGKDAVAVYERSDRRREEISLRADLTGRLRRALEEDRFVLHAQPVVPLRVPPAPMESYELLLRLRADDGTLLAPGSFLRHAERHGMVVDIDRWVLRQAVGELHRAGRQGRELSLAVNFSARTVQDPRIVEDLAALLAEEPIPAGSLLIEVTETAAITNVTRAVDLARQLQGLGCKLALDDFGAGFASFYYLKHLVFDYLKIDGEFIDRLPTSATDQLVVRAVVDIAKGLGAQVIAERVADDATVALLADLGVDFGQGYFLGRPAPLPGAPPRP